MKIHNYNSEGAWNKSQKILCLINFFGYKFIYFNENIRKEWNGYPRLNLASKAKKEGLKDKKGAE